jgi:hypothetical protein
VKTPLFPLPWMYGRRQLSRVEVAVYAVVIGTLCTMFISYLTDYMEMAEKVAMETTVRNVTAAINLRYAMQVVTGDRQRTERWPRENPFELARTFPPNYRGLLGSADAAGGERPAWLFDAPRAELVYLPRLYKHLEDGAVDELRFRLEPNASGHGFVLAPTTVYTLQLSAIAKNSQVPCKVHCTALFS